MAITAAFVVSASVITERSGPVIGALIATLPISAGPSYVFLALDHDAAFIAEGALASLPINAATILLGLTYAVLAQRFGVWLSCRRGHRGVARARHHHPPVPVDAARRPDRQRHRLCDLRAAAAAATVTSKMPLIARRWYDIPLRAALVATLVATVVTTSSWVGPQGQRHHRAVSDRVHQP